MIGCRLVAALRPPGNQRSCLQCLLRAALHALLFHARAALRYLCAEHDTLLQLALHLPPTEEQQGKGVGRGGRRGHYATHALWLPARHSGWLQLCAAAAGAPARRALEKGPALGSCAACAGARCAPIAFPPLLLLCSALLSHRTL